MLLTFTSDLRAPPSPPAPPPAAHPALGCSAVPSPTAVCTAQPSPSPAPIPHPSCMKPCFHPASSPSHIQHSSCIKPCSHLLPFPHHPASSPAPIPHPSCPKGAGAGSCRAGCRMGSGPVLLRGGPRRPALPAPHGHPRGQQGWDGSSPQPGKVVSQFAHPGARKADDRGKSRGAELAFGTGLGVTSGRSASAKAAPDRGWGSAGPGAPPPAPLPGVARAAAGKLC